MPQNENNEVLYTHFLDTNVERMNT